MEGTERKAHSNNERKEEIYPFDAIVIMPYSSNISTNGRLRLSYFSAQAVHAGFHLWEEKKAPKIIIPGESTFGPAHPPTAELMIRYLKQKGVPESQIVGLNDLNSSIYQLEAIKKLQAEGLQKFLTVSLEFHRKRVDLLVSRLHLPGETVEAEEILERHHLKTDRKQLLSLPQTKKARNIERVFRGIASLDRSGLLQKLTTQLWGPSVTDLHEIITSRSKLRKIKQK
ncbi:hypothetical protein A2Z23_03355 [Candidatus Curtissbacteria bacterium RBG_16_39_7]|uniref:DUF218 domain-containing protein n=1 Tax=Candidatus Curtissbacteria bacterium RBG_16_39_7 TaxID=1797707 RepID=A0A1F5G2C7_9BACT|nr:MAG: hypothetical protein A2Z23_03355 [Candidatus Curtissbacteria bacterium RBG_16_39_7]